MKRAIVTGANGFVGSYLVEELLQNHYEVLAVIPPESKLSKLSELGRNGLNFAICNFPDFKDLYGKASGIYDVFFHLAWGGVSGKNSKIFSAQMDNIQNSILAVKTAKKLCCKRFIGAGSIQEIECIKEFEETKPITNLGNYYKISKLAAHYYCKLEAEQQGIDFLWPRLTNTYGVGELSSRLINDTIRKLLQGESPKFTRATQLYNFIYVTDVARAYRLIAENGNSNTHYILGSEDVRPLRDYLFTIQSIVNPKVQLNFGGHAGISLSASNLYDKRFFETTGFQTNVSFEEGIAATKEFLWRLIGDKNE